VIRSLQRGHAPNCSSSGSVVGAALLSTAGAAVIVNAFAWRFLRWLEGGSPPGGEPPRLRQEGEEALLSDAEGSIAVLDAEGAEAARERGVVEVGGGQPVPGALTAPTEVHLAITDRCPVRCAGCYLEAGPQGQDRPLDGLVAELDALSAMGVLELAFGGGEVLLRPDLLDLLDEARARGMRPNLTSSGFGLSPELARALRDRVGQVNISLDGLGAIYRRVRGFEGAELGLRAIRTLSEAGVRVGVNTVLTRPLLEEEGALAALGEAIAQAGASEWQWLRFKPAGRGAEVYEQMVPSPAQAQALWPAALALEQSTGLVLRFDCAMMPFLVSHQPPLEALQRLAVRGCPGGHSLWARGVDGGWAPCSFVPGEAVQDPAQAWREQPTLLAWRERAQAPPEPCASCEYREICRGGCRVVAAFRGQPMAADPECPRVILWAA